MATGNSDKPNELHETTAEMFQAPSPAEIVMRLNLAASTFRKGASSKAEAAQSLEVYLEDIRGMVTNIDPGTHTRLLETLRPGGTLHEFALRLDNPGVEKAVQQTLHVLEGVLDSK
ncbi:MAG: hypothetical protein K1X64_08100 [Myxococcaceae bacterium]|nr:hypothetical protein [Myxococcaceae bacterium]